MRLTMLKIKLQNTTKFIFLINILYFSMLLYLNNGNMIIPDLLISIAFFLTYKLIYINKETLFTLNNLFVTIFLFYGIFFRYLLVSWSPELFQSFAPFKLENNPEYHIWTAITILLFVFVLGLVTSIVKVKADTNTHVYDKITIRRKSQIIYILLLVLLFSYRFTHLNYATIESYGQYDNLFNILSIVIQLIAYGFLTLFINQKSQTAFVLYLCYLVPTIILSIVNMWKGVLLLEVIVILISLSSKTKKIKYKYIVAAIAASLIIHPIVTINRYNNILNTSESVTLNSILKYNIENNLFVTYSNRLQYYDETYYCINAPKQDKIIFREEAGSIIYRFVIGLIPRAFWPEKPIMNVGQYVTYTFLHYPPHIYNNLSIGFISDAYLSEGFVGVIIYTIILGLMIKFISRLKLFKNQFYNFGAYLVCTKYIFSFMEGDIAAKMISMVQILIIVLLLKILQKFRIV